MAREDHEMKPDERATRSTRQTQAPTERLQSEVTGRTVASDRNWRAERASRRRKAVSIPTSRQELALWLQYGGWQILLIAVGVVIVLIFLLVLLRNFNQRSTANLSATATAEALAAQPIFIPPPTVTPLPTETSAEAQGVGGNNQGAQFVVTGTGTQGLFLRPDPNVNNQPIKTLPEQTIVTIVGEDYSGPDRVWKNVQDPEGTIGWAAAEWLRPVSP